MDPNTAWTTIETHTNARTIGQMAHDQLVDLYEAACALRHWLLGGGFVPRAAAATWTRVGLLNLLDSLVTQVTTLKPLEG